MCGIVAFFQKDHFLQEQHLRKAVKTLHHRGPDSSGIWISNDKAVGLGHARLSIIDLYTGRQPLSSENNRIHAVVNGEFYDFEKIREEMLAKGYKFKTKSDSEILIPLYQEYGAECLKYLRGEFAFVLWDEEKKQIFAARDRFGIKPLFHTIHNNRLLFASESKALFALGAPCKLNARSILLIENMLYPQDSSCFENMNPIKPGHFILSKGSELVEKKYWDFDYEKAEEVSEKYKEEDYIELFQNKFEESIKLRLRSDVPVSCYLSGGLDSCFVLGAMAKYATNPIRAFSISFEEKDYDESLHAQEMAKFCNTDLSMVPISEKDLAENCSDAIWNGESLLCNNSAIAKFVLSKHVRDAGFKVVLTGEGADEIGAGYSSFREDMLKSNSRGQDQSSINKMLADLQNANKISTGIISSHRECLPLDQVKNVLGYVPTMLKNSSSRGLQLASLHRSDYLKKYALEQDVFEQSLKGLDLSQLKGRDPVNQSLYIWSKTIFQGHLLIMYGDGMEMSHSIEGRTPFLDHKLVECCRNIPVPMKIKGLKEKYIIRESAKKYITRSVYEKQKHPFLAPPAKKNNRHMLNLMRETFQSELDHQPYYDKGKVLSLLNDYSSMNTMDQTATDTALLHVLSVCLLKKRFNASV